MAETSNDVGALLGQTVSLEARRAAAKIKEAKDIKLPLASDWNYGPCEHHDTPRPDCEYRACGGDLFAHQRVTTAWLYMNGSGLVASVPGSGKTSVVQRLICMLKDRGLLPNKAIIIVQTPVVTQWVKEFARFAPGIKVGHIVSKMRKTDRLSVYSDDWDVLIVGFHMLMQDLDVISRFSPTLLVTDDVDPLLNQTTRTHKAIVKLSEKAQRVVVLNASPLHYKPSQLWASMAPIGGKDIWGSLGRFEARYVQKEKVKGFSKAVGLQNLNELRHKLKPWYIKYDYDDLTDVNIPSVMPPQHVWLELPPRQREKYEELRTGILRIVSEQGETIKRASAMTMFNYGDMVCAGLPAFNEADGPGASVKLDWVMDRLQREWVGRKIIVYIKNPGLIEAFQNRLTAAGIGYATVWGRESNPKVRAAEQKKFWDDPNCQVFIGTSAMERGLNLQVSNILVCVDLVLNPSRIEQIVGRVRRAGSKFSTIHTFFLLASDTHQDKFMDVLSKRAALIEQVWESEMGLFESLSPLEMLQMFKP